jgi:hypothetical protein
MKKVHKKVRKVSTMKTTALTPAAQLSPPVVVSDPQPKSFIGQIFDFLSEPKPKPKSTLARIVTTPAHTATVVISHTQKTYNDYAAYCKWVGIEPDPIEHWDSLPDVQLPRDWKNAGKAFEYRNTLAVKGIVNRKFRNPEVLTKKNADVLYCVKTTPEASLMCVECCEYDFQPHWQKVTHPSTQVFHPLNKWELIPPFKGGGYRKRLSFHWIEAPIKQSNELRLYSCPPKIVSTDLGGCYPAHDPLTIEWKARQSFVADRQQRKRQHLQRVLEYMYLNFTVNNVLAGKSAWIRSEVVSLLRKPVWVKSIDGVFSAVLNKHTPSPLPVVIRDLKPKPHVFDYLPVPYEARTRASRCRHPLLREFTFTSGETIKMCPTCSVPSSSITETLTPFDKERRRVVTTVSPLSKAEQVKRKHTEQQWEETLEAEDLSMNRAMVHENLLFGDPSELLTTANARDRRANAWDAEQQQKEPLTQSIDWYSGETIYDRAGTNFNTNTRNRQNFWEEWNAGLRKKCFEIAFTQQSDTLLHLWLLIESKRS